MEQANGLRSVTYVDPEGRRWARLLPPQARDSDAEWGVPNGPPSLKALDLPAEVEVRLHNELHARGILTERDARRRFAEISAALMAALRFDAGRVYDIYRGAGTEGG